MSDAEFPPARPFPDRRLVIAPLTALLFLVLGLLPALGAPPPNDDFARRAVLSGTFASATGTLAEATAEAGEPDLGPPPARTLWWTWTAPADGLALFWASGSCPGASCPPAIALFTGPDLASLQLVATNAIVTLCRNWTAGICLFSSTELEGSILVRVTRGTHYQFRLDHASYTVGTDRFDCGVQYFGLHLDAPPERTAFVEGTSIPIVLAPIPTDVIGTFDEVSVVSWNSEPIARLRPPDFRAVWTPPAPGDYPIGILGTNRDGAFHFSPNAFIHVGPANDFFARRTPVPGFGGQFRGDVANGTIEADEPTPAGAGRRSLWWTWTAPDSGLLVLDARGVGSASMENTGPTLTPGPPAPPPRLQSFTICCGIFDPPGPPRVGPLISIYTGASLPQLVRVASNSLPVDTLPAWAITNRLTLPVTAGTTYQIAVDGVNGSIGPVEIDLELRQPNGRPTLRLGLESTPEGRRIRLEGVPGTRYILSSSGDLAHWTSLASGAFPDSGVVSIAPPSPLVTTSQFFQAARP